MNLQSPREMSGQASAAAEATAACASRRRIDPGVLDALRGLAALYVVLDHATALLWSGSSSLWFTDQGLPARETGSLTFPVANALHLSMLFGGQAVLLFFLISGFCIHYRQARLLRDGDVDGSPTRFNLVSFWQRRLRRLYPPLLVGLAVTAACDGMGAVLFPRFYIDRVPSAVTNWLGVVPSLPTLLASLTFQASLVAPAFGTNVSLWSLAYEFWFYALYPVLLIVLRRRGVASMVGLALLASAAAAVVSRLPSPLPSPALEVVMTWGVWALGALIAEMHVGRVRLPFPRLLGPLGLVGILVCQLTLAYYGSNGRGAPKDLPWGISMALVLAWVVVAPPARLVGSIERLARWLTGLGRISYSLYVVHLPVLALLSAGWLASHASLPAGLELAAFGACLAVLLGSLAWFTVERHFVSNRRAVLRVQRAGASPSIAVAEISA